MPPGQPSRRSLLSSIAGAFAWLVGTDAVKAAAPPAPPTPQAPEVIRVPETQPASADPFPAYTTHHYSAAGDLVYSSHVIGAATTHVYDAGARPPEREGYSSIAYECGRPATTRTAHASSRLETPGGEVIGREEYEVAVEGGRRLVRVTTLGPDGTVVKAEDVPF